MTKNVTNSAELTKDAPTFRPNQLFNWKRKSRGSQAEVYYVIKNNIDKYDLPVVQERFPDFDFAHVVPAIAGFALDG